MASGIPFPNCGQVLESIGEVTLLCAKPNGHEGAHFNLLQPVTRLAIPIVPENFETMIVAHRNSEFCESCNAPMPTDKNEQRSWYWTGRSRRFVRMNKRYASVCALWCPRCDHRGRVNPTEKECKEIRRQLLPSPADTSSISDTEASSARKEEK